MQTELTQLSPLLQPDGRLSQIGWARQPLLDCNLEAARFYALKPLQRFRIKRWDYYAVFSRAASSPPPSPTSATRAWIASAR